MGSNRRNGPGTKRTRAKYYYDNVKTHRVSAGLRIGELAKECGVSRDTISKIEKHHPTTEETLMKIINSLNELGKKMIDPKNEIKEKSRFR